LGVSEPPPTTTPAKTPPVTIDAPRLSREERATMLRILRSGILREAGAEPAAEAREIERQAKDHGR